VVCLAVLTGTQSHTREAIMSLVPARHPQG
jgi:hypothetical protein